jgi:hypothetical protein
LEAAATEPRVRIEQELKTNEKGSGAGTIMMYSARRIAVVLLVTLAPYWADAGGGWYLLGPPIVLGGVGGRPSGDGALRDWTQLGAFATAAECEAEHSRVYDRAVRELNEAKAEAKGMPAGPDRDLFEMAQLMKIITPLESLCVVSDDPRLR